MASAAKALEHQGPSSISPAVDFGQQSAGAAMDQQNALARTSTGLSAAQSSISAASSSSRSSASPFDSIRRSSASFLHKARDRTSSSKRHSKAASVTAADMDSVPSLQAHSGHDDRERDEGPMPLTTAYALVSQGAQAAQALHANAPSLDSSSTRGGKPVLSRLTPAPVDEGDTALTPTQQRKIPAAVPVRNTASLPDTPLTNTTTQDTHVTAAADISSSKNTDILSRFFNQLTERSRSQRRLLFTFFTATAVVAVFTAHVGQHYTKTAFLAACLVVASLGFVLLKSLERQEQDDRWLVEEQVRRILSQHGMSPNDILALFSEKENTLPGAPYPFGETVEWVNTVLSHVWPLIGHDYFAPFIDLLEDALMQQVPGIVHSARVHDLDQGSLPPRLKCFKVLPPSIDAFLAGDADGDENARAEHKRLWRKKSKQNEEDTLPTHEEGHLDSGDFINLEVDFVYRAPSTLDGRSCGKMNQKTDFEGDVQLSEDDIIQKGREKLHMLLYLGIGIKKLAAISVPVWIEVLGIEGRMRLRLQVTPVLPFVKHVAFTLIGQPKLEISAKPLGKKMVVDAMQLPLISSYILRSIERVVKGFVMPKAYTVDVAALLSAGEGPQHPYAVGVISLIIHQATDLAAADTNGKSDPFVQACFARSGRPLFSTRVVRRSCDPVWQESGFLLVTPDEIRAHDSLRLTVYDADRFSVDDPLGKIDVPLQHLLTRAMSRKGRDAQIMLEYRTDELEPFDQVSEVQGTLSYSVGFFGLSLPHKVASAQVAKQDEKDGVSTLDAGGVTGVQEDKDGVKAANLEQYMTGFDRVVQRLGFETDTDLLKARLARGERVKKLIAMIQGAEEQQAKAPMPELPSGIVCYHIHNIHGLEILPPQKTLSGSGRSQDQGMRPRTRLEDVMGEDSKFPSSYCYVCLNDQPILKTRTAVLNAQPYFNAGGERFVLDWRTCRLDFVVKDARMREADAVLGLVSVRLADVLKDSGRHTDWHTLTGGLGFGRMKISVVFRSLDVQIPAALRGWNVGVLKVDKLGATIDRGAAGNEKNMAVIFETYGGRICSASVEPVPVPVGSQEGGGALPSSSPASLRIDWPMREAMRLAIRQRYPCWVHVRLVQERRRPSKRPRIGHAVISLDHIVDRKPTTLRVPIFAGEGDHVDQDVYRALLRRRREALLQSRAPGPHERPMMEELCTLTQRDVPDVLAECSSGDNNGNGIRRIGTLELTLAFVPGIATEHKALVAGDAEMRVAWETHLVAVDAGEHPRPKKLAALRRSRSAALGASAGEDGYESDDLYDVGIPSEFALGGGGQVDGGYDDDGDEYGRERRRDSPGSSPSLSDDDGDGAVHRASAESRKRTLHRQQRGAAQLKGFRTAQWLKGGVQDGLQRLRNAAGEQRKRISSLDNEGVSHF
ncbi:hypothetical protein K437DRAFT_242815 [Tilletiaria anomala UBC 951]|uniref:C2 domain-containing protein n=1 Tax=Tilletiaria anomala (strain ATCC 24038 / CBS 436.72 / UBC 951) TaxID=1037660 RepID=A0A066WQT6_TILAU|nr:uncharacterized protein K437DRAFT_242815 [Tilletiaria anomala UBC 951]KDN53005.1 hypothetical protein K437DRAFT_242815 [Tilletiaria anomala UBC 951]